MTDQDLPPPPAPRIAYALIRDEGRVLLAQDAEVLTRVIILKVVAAISRGVYPSERTHAIRQALDRQDWEEAVVAWMDLTGDRIDSFPDEIVWTDEALDEESFSLELAAAPIYHDPGAD